MHFIESVNRSQYTLMNKLDDLVDDRHYVRLIDCFIDCFMQNHQNLFLRKGKNSIGRKAYPPSSLLKLYVYSYLNGISSSRKIEKECQRNIEMIWLMGYLVPDHKTIADFRRENATGINQVFVELVKLLKESGYIHGKTISIDGTKIRANASMIIDLDSISKKLENIDEQLLKYLNRFELVDSYDDEIEEKEQEKERLEKEIKKLEKEKQELEIQKQQLHDQGVNKISPTDPECRMMKGRQGLHLSYNFQAAVDAGNQMIVNIDVLSQQNDKGQLMHMVNKIEDELNVIPEEVLADAGYYVLKQIEYLENEKGIDCYVAINYNQQENKKRDLGIHFAYESEQNIYRCSQGQTLRPKYGLKKDSRRHTLSQAYVGINCSQCRIKEGCTRSKARVIYRYTNQDWRDTYEEKMKSITGKTKLVERMMLSEHPFGTIKYWMGYIPLKTRGKDKVKTEINLYATAYNLKRLINLNGFDKVMKLLSAKKRKAA